MNQSIDLTADDYIAAARATFIGEDSAEDGPAITEIFSDEFAIDDDAKVIKCEDGAWVQGWVWVPDPTDEPDTQTEEDATAIIAAINDDPPPEPEPESQPEIQVFARVR